MNQYVYTYACHEDELPLCLLELRTLFGADPQVGYLESAINVEVSRSPFMKQQMEVWLEADSLQALSERMVEVELDGATFKVVYMETEPAEYELQRQVERALGARIRGQAEMRRPERVFGVATIGERYVFGPCRSSEAVWLAHKAKPQNYSTALSTRVARAIANIAVPRPQGIKAIDPCCGIGTVLIEALSMGIEIVGFDLNPLAVRGARANLAHFGMPEVVAIRDMRELTGRYDAAVLDMPYNLCSVISTEEQLSLLQSLRRLADRAVIVTTETIDLLVGQAGFTIQDRCVVRKGAFARQVLLCRSSQ
ncbi:RNA methyltransferase [Paenibacillus cremeus]|uniref:RNA methyltransferase n=1 Tax=Paenibacillus cremeus TaxID=2163881 RepID=A0A559KDZ9_9BACL|nr:RNA methyltransferase [Paenibacillus cremeus]